VWCGGGSQFEFPGETMEDFIFAERTVNPDAVHLRLLRDHDVPATNPFNLAYRFGLQDRKQEARNRPG
jgi:hypothetical protein